MCSLETMKREEQEEHNEQSMDEHLQIAVKEIVDLKRAKEISDREIADLKRAKETSDREIADLKRAKVQLETKIAFLEKGYRHNQLHVYQHIQFNEFRKRRTNNETWYSPDFYTSSGGYKMSLHVQKKCIC